MIIDYRTAANFVGAKAAQTIAKLTLDLVEMVAGSLLSSGLMIRETVPLETIVIGHQEIICFDMVCSPVFPIVLGIPWLEQHDLCISWWRRSISFSSKYSQKACLEQINQPPGDPQPGPQE